MSTTKIKESNVRHSSYKKPVVSENRSFVAQDSNPMCLPSEKTGIVKVDKSRKKTRNGGYAPVSQGVAAAERITGMKAGATTYNDYIHFNYGTVSERYYPSSNTDEQS